MTLAYSLSQFKAVLHGLGYNLEPDGLGGHCCNSLDLDTQAAIREFQVHYKLPITGELDPTTQEKARQLVRNLQHSLNLVIHAELPINEFYGPHTTHAIQIFQQHQGLPVTGIASTVVRQALETEVKKQLRQQVCPQQRAGDRWQTVSVTPGFTEC